MNISRLITTYKCNKNCDGCCNKDWKGKPPEIITDEVVKKSEVILYTGGEPLLFPDELETLLDEHYFLKYNAYRIIYTAFSKSPEIFYGILSLTTVGGITLTLHDKEDAHNFVLLNQYLNEKYHLLNINTKFLRLNIFKEALKYLPPINLYLWDVKIVEWIKDCPLPNNEILYKLKETW